MTSKTVRPLTPHICDNPVLSRRALFRCFGGGVVMHLLAESKVALANAELALTPGQTQGPFYPVHSQKDKDLDLTRIAGSEATAEGQPVIITGKVLGKHGEPLPGVLVDIWQANARGRYRHPKDPNPAPLDPNFQGWGQVHSNRQGEYRFKTIIPGAYPAGPGWERPPHIHFKLSKKGYQGLTTQMYFPDQPLNNVDLILQQFSPEEQVLLVAKQTGLETEIMRFEFNLVIH